PEAEAELRAAVHLDPTHVNANYFLGICLRMQKRYAEAIGYQQAAVKLQGQFGAAFYEKGLCLEAQGDKSGAIEAYRDAVRHSPDMGLGHKQIGSLLFRANKPNEATTHLRQAALLMPEDAEVKKLLAELGAK